MEVNSEGETTGTDGATTRQNPFWPHLPIVSATGAMGEAPPAFLPNDSGVNIIHPQPMEITNVSLSYSLASKLETDQTKMSKTNQ